jgi:hypothetical protein
MVGFTNHQLVEGVDALLDDVSYASRQATYDLRRLIRKGVITRIPHTQRYQLTTRGRAVATLFSKAHGRVLTPGLASMTATLAPDIAARSPLAVAWRAFDRALDAFISDQMLAAPPPRPKLSAPPTRRRSQRTTPSVPSKGRCAA